MPSHPEFDQRYTPSGADGAWGLRFPTLAGPGLPLDRLPGGLAAGRCRRPRAAEPRAAGRVESSARAPPAAGRASDRDPSRATGGRPRAGPPDAAGVRGRAPPDLGGVHDRALDGPPGDPRGRVPARGRSLGAPRRQGARQEHHARLAGSGSACRSSPTTWWCATATTCSPALAVSISASTRRGSSTPAASWVWSGRASAGVSTCRHCPPRSPLRGWIFLEWGAEVAVQRLSPVERMSRLAQHRAIAVPWEDPVALLDLAARPAFVWPRPKGWRNIERSIARLLAEIAGE